MNPVSAERDERLSRLLDDLRRTNPTLRDPRTLIESHPDIADEAIALQETERELDAAVADWKSAADDETVSQIFDASLLETIDAPGANSVSTGNVPETFGRYRLIRRLGEGGMGTVYEAADPDLRRRVALKLPHFHGSAEKRKLLQQRFLREARAAAAVEHANVCPIYDVGEQDGRTFVVMGYVEGPSLAERLKASPVVDPPQAAKLVGKIAIGLAAVHGHGIVHRDLKPANILIRQKDGEPILTDFGLAQTTNDEGLTADGTIMGTPAYMAPEQADPSLGSATAKSDLYSLGVILFEMVVGGRPFSGSQLQIISQVSSKSVPRASTLRADIDPTLDAIIAKATARNRDDRYGTAEDFARALDDWLTREPAPATVAAASQSIKRSRPAWLVPAALAASLAFIAIAGFALLRGREPSEVPNSGHEPQNRGATAGGMPSVPPIRGAIDVQIWRKGQTDKPAMRLHQPAALPMAPGDWLRIEVELNRSAYAYVVWIDTEGKATPLYPWKESNWQSRPAEERPVQRLSLPNTDNSIAPLGGGPAGIETLMLLTRDEALPHHADLETLFAELPVQKAIDMRAAAWFENGTLVRNEIDRGPIRLDQAKESDDPILKTQAMLKTRLEKLFPYTRAVSFANRGD